MNATTGFAAELGTQLFAAPTPHRARGLRLPGGKRLWLSDDPGDSRLLASDTFATNLSVLWSNARGKILDRIDLGSGLITNAGVNLMANDFTWGNGATLKQMNQHAIGTGSTAAAAADVFLQTPNGTTNISGSTNGYMTGVQSYVSPNIYQTVATFTFTGAVAVTEWGLMMATAATLARTSAGTAPTNNTFTDSGATFVTAGQGLAGYTVEINATVVNTPTTTVMGQVLSNIATALTLQGPSASAAWLTLANAVAAVPSATVAYNVFPTMWDHKVFAAINAASGDTLQFSYKCTISPGG